MNVLFDDVYLTANIKPFSKKPRHCVVRYFVIRQKQILKEMSPLFIVRHTVTLRPIFNMFNILTEIVSEQNNVLYLNDINKDQMIF